MNKTQLTFLALTVSTLTLTGCKQDDSSDLSSYSGNTNPANLSSAAVANRYIDNYSAVNYSLAVSDLTGTRSATTLSTRSAATRSINNTPQTRTLSSNNPPSSLANIKLARSVDDTVYGNCGGYLEYDGYYDNASDYIDVIANARDYCDDQQYFNGYFYLEGYGEYSANGSDLTVEFEDFNYDDNYYGVSYTFNGQSHLQDHYPTSLTTSNMVIQDYSLGRSYMLRNWQEQIDQSSDPETLFLSGELYDNREGYVIVSTLTPLIMGAYNTPEAGQLRLRGSRSVAWVTFYSNGYLIEVDDNNDGFLDDEQYYIY